jgi:hypothetical protein
MGFKEKLVLETMARETSGDSLAAIITRSATKGRAVVWTRRGPIANRPQDAILPHTAAEPQPKRRQEGRRQPVMAAPQGRRELLQLAKNIRPSSTRRQKIVPQRADRFLWARLCAERVDYWVATGGLFSPSRYSASQPIQRRSRSRARTGSGGLWPATGYAKNRVVTPLSFSTW